MRHALWFLAACACGASSPPGTDAPASDDDAAARHALGPNDVSILLPLPADPAVPTLLAVAGPATGAGPGVPLVASGPIAGLDLRGDIGPKNGQPFALDQLQVVAVRFELCDRQVVGACPDAGEDGRLRLVLQPVYAAGGAATTHDIALHAFYPIPAAELAGVVRELRQLAALADVAPGAPLAVNPGAPAYLDRLRALVMRYARWDRLVRLTTIGQRAGSVAFDWVLRGVELDASGALSAMTIPALAAPVQTLAVQGGDTVYVGEPLVDAPAGFALALNGSNFDLASSIDRAGALETLAAINNPWDHDTVDLQCTTCHVATYLTMHRAMTAGVDPASLATAYQSPFNTSVASLANTEPRLIRAFGWVDAHPIISIRVANESARVASEIESRFPAAR
ncbi:MAG TPA: hypothetical protein VH165_35270 [Kofleriaceae bacterium]|nr:hypothetical protein [Kofleriaceae bacterium]